MHNFKYQLGEYVYVLDPVNIFYNGVEVMIINREYFVSEDIEVYTVVDNRGWTCAFRGDKLYLQ